MKMILASAAIGLMAGFHPAPVAAETVTDDERLRIESIIRDYLLKNPEVLQEAYEVLQARDRSKQEEAAQKTIAENGAAIFKSPDDYVAGNPDGNVTVVEYFDYNCQYCKRAAPEVQKLIESDKNVRVVLKEFPILNDGSSFAAKAAIASMKQGRYWELHRALIEESGPIDEKRTLEIAKSVGLDTERLVEDMKDDGVENIIRQNHELAQKLGINGTPAFIVGDKLIPGAISAEELAQEVATVREKGCAGC